MQRLSSTDKKRRRQIIRKTVRYSLIFVTVCALALLNTLLPFRSMLPALAIDRREEGELRLHFLDVGQGDCTLIEFPNGDVLAVDAGDGGWATENHIIRYIKGLKPKSFSALATHADYDHTGGLSALIRTFGATEIYLPALGSGTGAYQRFLTAANNADCALVPLSRYGTISRSSGAYCVCLSPYSAEETDSNEASCVLYLQYAGVRVLLCSDIPAARELKLMREYELDENLFSANGFEVTLDGVDILKAAHHGSVGSSAEEWLELVNPSVAVLSCGRGNRYNHPAAEALERLSARAEVYRTDELGDIVIGIKNGVYSVNA